MSLSIIFRADASIAIGTGHVMRCLTLAKALAEQGHSCRFICRDLQGHLGERIVAEGFPLTLLPAPAGSLVPDPFAPAHALWAEVHWAQDAAETRAVAAGADWLIVDHYAFDALWEGAAVPDGARLMVIDDLADRPHLADLLLDQNLGRRSAEYDRLVPAASERLIGPRYALLRPEFAATRTASLEGRANRGYRLREVLVTMGGVDLPNATGAVLKGLAQHPGLRITVVMGRNAPALEAVRAQLSSMVGEHEVLVDVSDMAQLMAKADLAVGAAGSTTWERCTLGLPTIVVILADNQDEAASSLDAAHAAISLGRIEASNFATRLAEAMIRAANAQTLARLSASAAAVADGAGTERVLSALLGWSRPSGDFKRSQDGQSSADDQI
jgi:UDP-2,4-diacetamido-2,4,6-trideoxy-beta-L-altropyranose hydrolase